MLHALHRWGLVPLYRGLILLLFLLAYLALEVGHVARIHGIVQLAEVFSFAKLGSLCMELLRVSSIDGATTKRWSHTCLS